jgi:hypothetical protein
MKTIISFLAGALVVVALAFLLVGKTPSAGSIRTIQDDFTAGLSIGDGGTAIASMKCATASWNPGSMTTSTAGTIATTTAVTITGAKAGSICFASLTSATSTDAMPVTCRVTAANTARVSIVNMTGATTDLATGTLRACSFQF